MILDPVRKWQMIIGSCLASVAILVALFSGDGEWGATSDPIRDVSHPTSQAREIAEHLAQGPIWVDPLVREQGSPLTSPEVRAAVEASRTPVFLFAAATWADDLAVPPEAVVQEVAEAVDADGAYLFFDTEGAVTEHWRGPGEKDTYLSFQAEVDAQGIADAVSGLDAMAPAEEDEDEDDPVLVGLLIGAVFVVPVWLLLRLTRFVARRRPRYLVGFR